MILPLSKPNLRILGSVARVQTISTTECPRRHMVTDSPDSTALINSDNLFLASVTLTLIMQL